MDSFQVDLWQPSSYFGDTIKTKYHLICIDTLSRYVFQEKLENKQFVSVRKAFISLLKKIRKMKETRFTGIASNDYITFISDLGGEFTSNALGQLLESNEAGIHHVADSHKAGMAERVIQTLEHLASSMLQNIDDFNIDSEIPKLIEIYNRKPHSSLPGGISPDNFIKKKSIVTEPKYLIGGAQEEDSIVNGEFFFDVNKQKIDKKMEIMKKQFPMLSAVKLSTTKEVFVKSAASEAYTHETFFINGYKRPYLSRENPLLKVCDLRGRPILGAFTKSEVKLVNSYTKPLKVNAVLNKTKQGNKRTYEVTVEQFPHDMIITLDEKVLAKLPMTVAAKKQKLALK